MCGLVFTYFNRLSRVSASFYELKQRQNMTLHGRKSQSSLRVDFESDNVWIFVERGLVRTESLNNWSVFFNIGSPEYKEDNSNLQDSTMGGLMSVQYCYISPTQDSMGRK